MIRSISMISLNKRLILVCEASRLIAPTRILVSMRYMNNRDNRHTHVIGQNTIVRHKSLRRDAIGVGV